MGKNIFGGWEPDPEPPFIYRFLKEIRKTKQEFWDDEGAFMRGVSVAMLLLFSTAVGLIVYFIIGLITGDIVTK